MGQFDGPDVLNISIPTSAPGGGSQVIIGVSSIYGSIGPMGFEYASRTQSNTLYAPAIVGLMSMLSIVGLLTIIGIKAYKNKGTDGGSIFFFKTPIGLVLLAMLLCDLIQSVGWMVNFAWGTQGYQVISRSCRFQGAVEVAATLGGAIWSSVLSIISFSVLFLGIHANTRLLYWIILLCLFFIFAITIAGPFSYRALDLDPALFYGPQNQWCYIAGGDPISEGWIIFVESVAATSAAISLILYVSIVAKLAGYLSVHGRRIAFHWSDRSKTQHADKQSHSASGDRSGDRTGGVAGGRGGKYRGGQASSRPESINSQVRAICRKLVLYPVVYICLNVPIMTVRLWIFTHPHESYLPWVSFIAVSSIEAASGMADVALLLYTRHSLVMKSHNTTTIAGTGIHVHTLHQTHHEIDGEVESHAMSRGPFTGSRQHNDGRTSKAVDEDDDNDLLDLPGSTDLNYLPDNRAGSDLTLSELELGGKADSVRTGKSVDHAAS